MTITARMLRNTASLARGAALALALSCSFPLLAQERPDPWERMRRNDADGDGRISRDEFRGPAAFFERADADKDGFVTAEEARAARGRAGSPAPDRPGPGAFGEPGGPVMLLRRLDADHDDRLSRHEWDDFFRKADENGDEILRLEEWRAALRGEPFKDDAPQVGVPAPKVKAKSLKSGRELDLSQPKRTTVLVFGSHT